jgi:hypothetical protein
MYIAQDYIYGDLPDQVVAGGIVLSKQDAGGYEFPIWYTDGQNDIQFVGHLWLLTGPLTDYRTFESSCLIGTYIFIPFDEFDPPRPPILVEDQFANSYNVEMSMFYDYVRGSCVVNRTSLGRWEGIAYGVGQGTWPSGNPFDDASVDLKVKLTICELTIWELQYEPIAFYCDNLDPEAGLTCEEAIYNSGPGPFLQTVHYKFSEDNGQDGQFQSSPNQGNGFYALDSSYDDDIYGGLPLFGSKVS